MPVPYLARPLLLLSLLLPALGCATDDGRWVELRGERYSVEIADDDASRAQGLMNRESMPADQGMLFIFEREGPQSFWMRNTLIPLDILYFDDERQLVSASRRVPPCRTARCPSYPSRAPARYVLELNGGTAERIGATTGDELNFGPGIPASSP